MAVYKVDSCDDYYIRVTPPYDVKTLAVTDNRSSEFHTNIDDDSESYQAYIKALDFSIYTITINGIEHSLGAVLFY